MLKKALSDFEDIRAAVRPERRAGLELLQ